MHLLAHTGIDFRVLQKKGSSLFILACLFLVSFTLNIYVVSAVQFEELNIAEGDAIWYEVSASTSDLIGIDARSDGISEFDDVHIFLYDPDGDEVASGYGRYNEASITYTATASGNYKVKVYLDDADSGGTRSVTISSRNVLSQLYHDVETVHDVAEGDAVWYDLTADASDLIGINAWTDGDTEFDDVHIYLYDPSGKEVTSGNGRYNKASVVYTATTSGNYKVKVYLEDADSGGKRTLSTSSPVPLSPSPHYVETVPDIPEGDALWYKLSVSTDDLIGIQAWTDGVTEFDDVHIFLYDPNGKEVSTDHGRYNKASIVHSPAASGKYSVKVYLDDADSGGTRSLSLSSPILLSQLPHTVETVHNVAEGHVEWYERTVSSNDMIAINAWTDGATEFDDVSIAVYDPQGVETIITGIYNKASITYVANASGKYVIKVQLSDADSGGVRNLSTSIAILTGKNSKFIPPAPKNIDEVIQELPELLEIPFIASVGATVAVGTLSSGFGGIIFNVIGNYLKKLDEIIREFLKVGLDFTWDEIEQKILRNEPVIIPGISGELKQVSAGGVVIFLAFAIEFFRFSDSFNYNVNPIVFLFSLAFFAMFAEISHELVIKYSSRSFQSRSVFEFSFIGTIIALVSGMLGFVIPAAGGTKILKNFTSPLEEAIVSASGSFFNLMIGILLVFISVVYNIHWLAFAGALPNLATAAFCLFPAYPFEGRRVYRGNKGLWGFLFLFSMMFYLFVVLSLLPNALTY